ncbi:MAG: TraB/GumN family protein, partial [Gammaproteobacteria bacterium]|nr:TraB/GumN family protein [Gammaproteobacteria bacterium]
LDFSLSLRAAGNGLKVVGLETLEEQLGFLELMPLEQQIEMLSQAAAEVGRVQEVHDRMVEAYLEGDLEVLQAETDEQLSELGAEAREFFIAEGIHARNHRMLASLLPELEQASVFTAIGALHLPGEQGLIQLLRDSGYRLAPLPLPFSNP